MREFDKVLLHKYDVHVALSFKPLKEKALEMAEHALRAASKQKVDYAPGEFGRMVRKYREQARISLTEIADVACMQPKDLVAVEEGRTEMSEGKMELVLKFFPDIEKIRL